jgi:predicted O-methyltransferase YrrM
MRGNNLTRLSRLVSHLVTHPRYVPRYLAHGLWTKRMPLDLGLPFFSYSAIEALEQILRPDMEVFEYGGGGSTLFFARRVRRVTTVENSAEWIERVGAKLRGENLSNVEFLHHPLLEDDLAAFLASPYLFALEGLRPDLILVDGRDKRKKLRQPCFYEAEKHIAPGGFIVLDNSWAYPELRTHNRARHWREFRSVGPSRIGVTTTDIYYY